ncbi:MAG: hypothetical protein EXR63_05710 [Dehalococcoidia bacterium]|nr:hypothetical protein [Dehalococcoidia bacterium]
MKFKLTDYTVGDLVAAYQSGSLARNPEYQRAPRGACRRNRALSTRFSESIRFLPLFLERKELPGLGGTKSERFEIIDGQQRILSLNEYLADNFDLLGADDPNLRLPLSLRTSGKP